MANVKVGHKQTNTQTGQKQYAPHLSGRGHKKEIIQSRVIGLVKWCPQMSVMLQCNYRMYEKSPCMQNFNQPGNKEADARVTVIALHILRIAELKMLKCLPPLANVQSKCERF